MRQRDIMLVPFPFSDQSGRKVRPVLVVSNDHYNRSEDLIVCALTSNLRPSDYTVFVERRNLEEGVLYERSAIKVDSILKIRKSLAIKTIGMVDKPTFAKVRAILMELFSAR